ncbi:MAG: hypothetical protein D6744_01880 [Planctomycetota bacterium]|nr:MAG: hypothetical protein D6744_01880 [Planctomycetota bacterium]
MFQTLGRTLLAGIVFSAAGLTCGSAAAQDAAPATAPAGDGDRKPITARVIEIHGDVKYSTIDSDEWKPLKLDDQIPELTKILTGVRSSVKLQIGDEEPYTCMLIESVGLTILSEAAIQQNTKRVRVGVGYGRIRAGVAEGGLQSDFTVDSPVATLSKRGTWGFTLYYERDTDIFEIGLTDRGLVEAINRVTGRSRQVAPRELVTQAMRLWLDEAPMRRNVPVADILGQGDVQVAFNKIRQDGLGVLAPGQGASVFVNLNNPRDRAEFARRLRRLNEGLPPLPLNLNRRVRPEAFFGTGRGDQLLNFVIDAKDPLVQSGAAKPGTYRIRRSAVQRWLQENR